MPVKYLGIITGKQFEQTYNEMEVKGMKPKASTCQLITGNGGSTLYADKTLETHDEPLLNAMIFYEFEEQPKQEKKPIKLEL